MERISHIPAILIHGRADVSGPVHTAWEVHQRWTASTLRVIEDEGHGGFAIVGAWKQALATLADIIIGTAPS